MSPATSLAFGALLALEVLQSGRVAASGCNDIEKNIIARQQERLQQQVFAALLQNRLPDMAALQDEAATVNRQLSPSCLQMLQQTMTVAPPQPGYRPAPPPSYYRGGNGTTVIPGVGGCGPTGCSVR